MFTVFIDEVKQLKWKMMINVNEAEQIL